jgi:imidazolonepropionase
MFDLVIDNIRIYSCERDLSCRPETALGVKDGRIAALDPPPQASRRRHLDGRGRLLLPGFVDCHTHAVYAGDRLDEYLARLSGQRYEAQQQGGGGIFHTVQATRRASLEELVDLGVQHAAPLIAEGVTTLEVKSGYGLERGTEMRLLEAARALGPILRTRIVPTFLGAHVSPPGEDRSAYLSRVTDDMLPACIEAGLTRAVDIYVDTIAFGPEHLDRLFEKATACSCLLHAHTDQLTRLGATARAAEWGAVSCDHLDESGPDEVAALAKSGTVAVLLPTASLFLGRTRKPPVEALRKAAVPIAIASDLNPGTAPDPSLLRAAQEAVRHFLLTPAEALLGITKNAARALDPTPDFGTLTVGQSADFNLWDLPRPESLLYAPSGSRPSMSFYRGEPR